MTDGLIGALIGGGFALAAQLVGVWWQHGAHKKDIQARYNEYRHDGRQSAYVDLVQSCELASQSLKRIHDPRELPDGYSDWSLAAIGIRRRIETAHALVKIVGPPGLNESANECRESALRLVEHLWDTSHLSMLPRDAIESAEAAVGQFSEKARGVLELLA